MKNRPQKKRERQGKNRARQKERSVTRTKRAQYIPLRKSITFSERKQTAEKPRLHFEGENATPKAKKARHKPKKRKRNVNHRSEGGTLDERKQSRVLEFAKVT